MGNRYLQLTLSERVYIQAQLGLGFKAASIAAAWPAWLSVTSRGNKLPAHQNSQIESP